MKKPLLILAAFMLAVPLPARTLIEFKKDQSYPHVKGHDGRVMSQGDGFVYLGTNGAESWSSISFLSGTETWDLSQFTRVDVEITNLGSAPVRVGVLVGNPDAKKKDTPQLQGYEYFDPGETRTMSMTLRVGGWMFDQSMNLVGMRWAPGQMLVDTTQVGEVKIAINSNYKPQFLRITNIQATGNVTPMSAETFLPFVDQYGQFQHRDWPGKIQQDSDFVQRREQEAGDLAAHPGPENWSKYGGWADGPKQEASGFFRVEKIDGKWWLVDPDGYLFWSNGPTCIARTFGWTPVSGREHYFEGLPEKGTPLAQFYNQGDWAPHGFYKENSPYTYFRFFNANLYRKYGEDWFKYFSDSVHLRLRSWGMNTIANWAEPEVYRQGRTPYVANIFVRGNKELAGSRGYWGKFHDVFDPSFRHAIHKGLSRLKHESTDPWCIGFFIDNELSWGNETDHALETLSCPPDQQAKQVFVADLKVKYKEIWRLNVVWGTKYQSWDTLLKSTKTPNVMRAREDLEAFTAKTAETYFRTVKEELRKIAPNHLYLGARFAWFNEFAVHAAARHCDVVSYNQYRHSLRHNRLADFIDRPIIIGEYHFGAIDRGHFHPGIVEAKDQTERARLYQEYLRSALENPQMIGVHWFQYMDEHIAGRGDEENYNVGLVDIADNPYPEMIQAIRELSHDMYSHRQAAESR